MNAIDTGSLLDRTSRTFALALPLLPAPVSEEASLAYLLFRVVDTLEDGPEWSPREKGGALLDLAHHFERPTIDGAEALAGRWLRLPPADDGGLVDLLGAYPALVAALLALPSDGSRLTFDSARRTALGMRGYLLRDPDGPLVLRDIPDLRGYCYVVAGVVGELLTEFFLRCLPGPEPPVLASRLRELAPCFGEALQLVNILRDETADRIARRRLVPDGAHAEAARLAAHDLVLAGRYTGLLDAAGAPAEIRRFTAFLTRLAAGTLAAVEREGPGARLSREAVFEALGEVRIDGRSDHESSRHR